MCTCAIAAASWERCARSAAAAASWRAPSDLWLTQSPPPPPPPPSGWLPQASRRAGRAGEGPRLWDGCGTGDPDRPLACACARLACASLARRRTSR
eukprot:4718514-Pyramimonas_sp.AAC.1